MLDPLQQKLAEFQTRVETVYDNETRDRTALGEQVRQLMALNQSLSEDAKNLTTALKGSNKTQGAWGELVLERVLESAGLRKGEEYDVQESHGTEDGERRPDVTLHLPEDRPGSLRELLHVFERHRVSLASIHSSRTPAGEVHFRVGFVAGSDALALQAAAIEIDASGIGRVLVR